MSLEKSNQWGWSLEVKGRWIPDGCEEVGSGQRQAAHSSEEFELYCIFCVKFNYVNAVICV